MGQVAFYIVPEEIAYFSPVIRSLPPELVDIHISPLAKRYSSLDEMPDGYKPHLAALADLGYTVLPLDAERVGEYGCVALTAMFVGPYQRHFDWNRQKHPRIVSLTHSLEDAFRTYAFAASFYLFGHQRQAETRDSTKFTPHGNPAAFRVCRALPHHMRNEFAATGLYHLGEWAKKRHHPKGDLQEELARAMGVTFAKDKPIVFCLESLYHNLRQLGQGITQLAQEVNLIVKGDYVASIPGAFRWTDHSFAPNLPRFAADYILAGFQSGTLASSTMLGLNVIPYYTRTMESSLPWEKPGPKRSYRDFLPGKAKAGSVSLDILAKINPPTDILDTRGILKRIHNRPWWESYHQRLPLAQREIFGQYLIEGAAEATGNLLLRVLNQGTFGEGILAVQPRLEYTEEIERLVGAAAPQ